MPAPKLMPGSIQRRGKVSWSVVLDFGPDPLTGRRRQVRRTVRGSKDDAKTLLAWLLLKRDRQLVEGPQPEPQQRSANHCWRPGCSGTILDVGDGSPRCLLCGRGPDAGAGIDWDLHLASISALMSQPPGSAVSLRSPISDEMYERPARGPQRRWLPWAGY